MTWLTWSIPQLMQVLVIFQSRGLQSVPEGHQMEFLSSTQPLQVRRSLSQRVRVPFLLCIRFFCFNASSSSPVFSWTLLSFCVSCVVIEYCLSEIITTLWVKELASFFTSAIYVKLRFIQMINVRKCLSKVAKERWHNCHNLLTDFCSASLVIERTKIV